jgi:hypothetical protein
MPEAKKTTPKKKMGIYVTLTAEQRAKLDEIGKRDLFLPNAAGDVIRIFLNKNWQEIIGEEVKGDGSLFPEHEDE